MHRRLLFVSLFLLALFALLTVAVRTVDVQPIGPLDSSVGFASLNAAFHRLTGVHLSLYVLTDWLSILPLLLVPGFALLGLSQWVKRKSLFRVDRDLLLLGGFYLAVFAAYALFELFPVNYRPVLIEGVLEASYPSSTTLLVLCVVPAAIFQLRRRVRRALLRRFLSLFLAAFALFMLAGRLVSGVHWLMDVLGGVLLSASLLTAYGFFCTVPRR